MSNKVLTIIIPSYNMERYLSRCLGSLLVSPEKMPLFEALIINDGSKDNTSAVAKDYVARFPDSFRLIEKDNGHYGSCVNRGLNEAQGVFVKILDADDSFNNSEFEAFLDFLSGETIRNSADLVLSDYCNVTGDGAVVGECRYHGYDGEFALSDITDNDVRQWFIHGLTYRLDILRSINYHQTEGIAYTDHEWSFVPLAPVRKAVHFNQILYRYTVGRDGQSISPRQHAKNLWMEERVIENMLEHYKDMTITQYSGKFIEKRLVADIENLYNLYLVLLYPYLSSLKPLEHLDARLREQFPILYEQTNLFRTTVAHIHFFTIRNWRKGETGKIKMQRLLYVMADKLNRILSR